MLKIGVVGVGFIGRRHIDILKRIDNAKIVAIVDCNATNANHVAKELGEVVAYATVGEMLAHEEIDVVHNCTPTFMHYDINAQVILQGKHLYCEKPLSLDAAQADELLGYLGKVHVANGVNFSYRMNAMAQELRERVNSIQDGRPLMVTASYVQDWMLNEDDFDWRLDLKTGGRSRTIADIGAHLFDLSQYVLGKKIVAVNADTMIAYKNRFRHENNGGTFSQEKGQLLETIEVKNEDAANIMVKFQDGTGGFFQVSQVAAGHKNDMRLRVDLTQASYEWRQEDSDKLYIGRRDRPNEVLYREASALSENARQYVTLPAGHTEGWHDALYNAIHCFYQSIEEQTYANTGMPYATVADGAWIMKVIEACLKSHRTGRWIDVETGILWQGAG